jgi:hypothetical protein
MIIGVTLFIRYYKPSQFWESWIILRIDVRGNLHYTIVIEIIRRKSFIEPIGMHT